MKVLIIGAYGQVGQELIRSLSSRINLSQIICTDIRPPPTNLKISVHENLNVLNKTELYSMI
jgi:dTDP-4-dehydrorhamnose reductase